MIGDDEPIENDDIIRDSIVVDETTSAADPKVMARARQKRKFQEDQRGDWWRKALADPIGRMVLWEVLVSAGTFEERFACSPAGFPDPLATWFQAGEKAFGQRLYQTLLMHDRLAVAQMHEEHDRLWAKPEKPKRTKLDER